MFSLVITIISVALVASLALATLYYGGTAFNRGQADAQAAKINIQGQQLLAATDLFKVHHGRIPNNVEELVSADYLQSEPVAKAAVQSALAGSAWFMPLPGEAIFLLSTTFPEACRSINEKSYGKRAILNGVLDDIQVQCYGPDTSVLYSMAAKDPKAVQALVGADEATVVGAAPIPALIPSVPTDNSSPAWSSPPGDIGDDNPGSGGPGSTTPPAGALSVGAAPREFSAQVGQSSYQVVTLQNIGNAALSFTATPVVSGGDGAFTLASTCGPTLAANASCNLTVTFAPTAAGSVSAVLEFDTSVSDPSSISLSGTGTVQRATGAWAANYNSSSAPTDTIFPLTTTEATSASKTYFLFNSEGVGTLAASFALTGTDAAHFKLTVAPVAVASNNSTTGCGATLSSTQSASECTATSDKPNIKVTVAYAPTAAGSHTAQLVASSSNGSIMPAALTLTGSAQESLPAGYVQFNGKTYTAHNATIRTHSASVAYCVGLTTYGGGWRLPSITELEQLRVAAKATGATINLTALGWTSTIGKYWSASTSSSGHLYSNFSYNTATVGTSAGKGGAVDNGDSNQRNALCIK